MKKSLGLGWRVLGVVACLPLLGACGSAGESAGGEPLGEATLELSTVPSGALCLQVIGTGASAFTATAALTANASTASISLSRLPLGASTITANVFNAACSAISGTQPTWVADPQAVTFRAGALSNITLTFRPQNPVIVNANFVGNVTDVTGGYFSSGIVLSDGTTRIAGNEWPVFAGGTTFANSTTLTGVAQLVAPREYNGLSCARTTAGTVQCFGVNTAGELGPNVAAGATSGPVTIPNLSNVTEIGLGAHHACAISNGGIVCWGANSSGQLGNGTTTNSSTIQFTGLPVTWKLGVGYDFTCAMSGQLVCWGNNAYGQLGDGTTTNRTSPVWLSLTGIVSMSAGNSHVCAVRGDGIVKCWGYNGYGQLGDGTYTNRLTPTQVPGITDAVEVAAGANHTCVRHKDGTVSCWGQGSGGALGDGVGDFYRFTPKKVPGVTTAVKISAGYDTTYAILDNRTVLCWGQDDAGQCATGGYGERYTPVTSIIQ